PPTSEMYTLSLHDALPIFGTGGGNFRPTLRCAVQKVEFRFAECSQKWLPSGVQQWLRPAGPVKIPQLRWQKTVPMPATGAFRLLDRKSTRLNSSHVKISYA